MAKIDVKIDTDKDLTTFIVEGSLTADEILEYSIKYYDDKPTRLVLWDGTNGTVSSISNVEFSAISQKMRNFTKNRLNGKTALVGRFDVDFGLARSYESHAAIAQLPVKYRAFCNVDEAMQWLEQEE